MSTIDFEHGSAEINNEAIEKLELLAGALKARPNLKLEIMGAAGGPAELMNLKLGELDQTLQSMRWREIRDGGDDSIALDSVVLTPEDRKRLIERTFATIFPEETMAQSGSAAMEDSAVSAQPSATDDVRGLGGFLRKLFGGSSEETATQPAIDSESDSVTEAVPTEAVPQLTIAQMESRLLEGILLNDNTLYQLADARAETVRAHIETIGEISPERLFIVKPEDPTIVDPNSGQSQVIFELE